MRKRFSSEILKNYFFTAWSCLPQETQSDLRKFIRQVREVENLEGTYIGCPDGTRYGPIKDGEGFTFLYKDDDVAFCDIILSSFLLRLSRASAICTILHELAHAFDYFTSPEIAIKTTKYEAESSAWDKAILWAKDGISDSALVQGIEYSVLRAKLHLQLDELTELTETVANKNS